MEEYYLSLKYLLSVNEATKLFGIGRDRLYSLIKSEEGFPVVKIGNNYKINRVLFEEWLDKASIEGRVI